MKKYVKEILKNNRIDGTITVHANGWELFGTSGEDELRGERIGDFLILDAVCVLPQCKEYVLTVTKIR